MCELSVGDERQQCEQDERTKIGQDDGVDTEFGTKIGATKLGIEQSDGFAQIWEQSWDTNWFRN